jgi:hypothetical protein
MGLSSKSKNLGIMLPMGCGSMGGKMYFMNNMVVVDHHGLFIYLDVGYPCSFHDVTIMCESLLYIN